MFSILMSFNSFKSSDTSYSNMFEFPKGKIILLNGIENEFISVIIKVMVCKI